MAGPVLALADVGVAGLRDVPLQLRALADRLEAEKTAYGPGWVCRVVVVERVSGESPRVSAFGDVEHVAQAFMDLHAGADQLLSMRHPSR